MRVSARSFVSLFIFFFGCKANCLSIYALGIRPASNQHFDFYDRLARQAEDDGMARMGSSAGKKGRGEKKRVQVDISCEQLEKTPPGCLFLDIRS